MATVDVCQSSNVENGDGTVGKTLLDREVVETSAFGQRVTGGVDLFFELRNGKNIDSMAVRMTADEAAKLAGKLVEAVLEAKQ
jgi:hypothetical protein